MRAASNALLCRQSIPDRSRYHSIKAQFGPDQVTEEAVVVTSAGHAQDGLHTGENRHAQLECKRETRVTLTAASGSQCELLVDDDEIMLSASQVYLRSCFIVTGMIGLDENGAKTALVDDYLARPDVNAAALAAKTKPEEIQVG